MKKKIIYGLLLAVAMVTASSSFVSCKDYEGDDVNGLKEQIALQDATLRAFIQAQINAIKQCECDPTIASRLATIESDYLKAAALNGYATEAWVNGKGFTTLGDVQSWVNQQGFSSLTLDAVKEWVNAQGFSKDSGLTEEQVNNLIQTMLTKTLGENNKVISDMITNALANGENPYWTKEEIINYFNTQNPDLSGYATKDDLNNLRNYILLGDSVKNAYVWAKYSYERIIAQGDSLKGAYDSIANVRAEALKNFNEAKALADSAIKLSNKALDSIQIVDAKVADLDKAMKEADKALQDQIDNLEKRVAANEKNINNILGTLKKQITGVIIQGTYSPVLGNGSLPLGIQTNLLAAYASKSTANVDFPSIYDEDYADSTTVLTAADQAYLQGLGYWPGEVSLTKGQWVLTGKGNAGKVYLTVNPTNIDFEGTNFDLVNSKGQISRMKLENLKACDEVLNFGWTRGASVDGSSANGFYEAEATVATEDITKLQANINTEKFQKAFKEQLNSKGTGLVSHAAAMDLARAVYGSLEPLQRFGVRAEWQDATMGGATRAYTSAFDIAATVVNPLGFGFKIPDSKYTRLPVFDTNYLKNKFHIKAQAKTLVVTAEEKATGKYSMWLVVDSLCLDASMKDVYRAANGQIYDLYNGMIVYYDTDWFDVYRIYGNAALFSGAAYINLTPLVEEMYGQFNASLASINDVIAQANKRIDYVVSYIDRYNSYATKVNKFIRNANNLLQPVLLWCDGQNVGQLGGVISGNYAAGTMVPAGGAVALVPTTYTLELLAPAYKKSVVCTNVYKDGKSAQGVQGDLETALKAVNGELQKGGFALYEGQSLKNAFIFNADSKYEGMTFEFAYTALDYTGQIAGRKFYLTVGPAKK